MENPEIKNQSATATEVFDNYLRDAIETKSMQPVVLRALNKLVTEVEAGFKKGDLEKFIEIIQKKGQEIKNIWQVANKVLESSPSTVQEACSFIEQTTEDERLINLIELLMRQAFRDHLTSKQKKDVVTKVVRQVWSTDKKGDFDNPNTKEDREYKKFFLGRVNKVKTSQDIIYELSLLTTDAYLKNRYEVRNLFIQATKEVSQE